jgi:hypothetical protein
MKIRNLLLVLVACLAIVPTMTGQTTGEEKKAPETKYRRSSLYTMMIDDAGLINGHVIKETFIQTPIPDKFNDHCLTLRTFDSKRYALTPEERAKDSLAKKSNSFGKMMATSGKGVVSDATGGLVDTTNTKDLPLIIKKYFVKNNVAKEMVSKWFNRSAKGTFNMQLVGERGSYDATEMQAGIAKTSARGLAALADAGSELIGNTFVVVTRFNYVDKKEVAAAANGTLNTAGNLLGGYGQVAAAAATTAVDVLAKGYVVKSTSFLYKLVWNDSIDAVFYQNLWTDDSFFDIQKKEAYDKSNLFSLVFIGKETAWADVQSSIFTKKSEEELIRIATVRSLDAVIAKLEMEYDVFKTKTPLYSAEPVTAKIGLKEGIEGGDKYEVLEQVLDEKSGRTKYVSVGKIKVDKNQIWDNRYMAGELQAADTTLTPEMLAAKLKIDRTYFDGASKKYYPGMLIKQVK